MNNIIYAPLWLAYAIMLVAIAKYFRGKDNLLPGKVGVVVQAFAYVATYISAVALVGFGGLCYIFGMQMLLIAAGNVWLGTKGDGLYKATCRHLSYKQLLQKCGLDLSAQKKSHRPICMEQNHGIVLQEKSLLINLFRCGLR